MHQQRGEGPTAKLLRRGLKTTADQLVTANRRAKRMRRPAAISEDKVLGLKPLQQCLDRRVVRSSPTGIESLRELTNHRRPLIPKQGKDRQLRIRDVLGCSCHDRPLVQT